MSRKHKIGVSESGVLEINTNGVLYFHSSQTGTSVLRICGLPKDTWRRVDATKIGVQLDITLQADAPARVDFTNG